MSELKSNLTDQLLGHLLSDETLFYSVHNRIDIAIFENEVDRVIYDSLSKFLLSGKKLNTVKLAYETGQPEFTLVRIQQLISGVDYKTTVDDIIDLVLIITKQVKLADFIENLRVIYLENKNTPETAINFINHFLININRVNDEVKMLLMPDHVDNVIKVIQHNMNNSGLTGLPTPLEAINRKTNGLQGGDLIILAGETSQGKTSLALTICSEASKEAYCHFITLEMTENQLTSRLMAYDTGYNSNKMLTGRLTENDLAYISGEAIKTRGLKMYIDNTENDIDRIINNINRTKALLDTKLVVIDYLQLLKSNEAKLNKEQKTADITRRLKNLAIELNIPVILVSQLSRDRDNPYPRLSRLRDSGQIEEAADIVIFVYRAEFYNRQEFSDGSPSAGRAEIIFAKGRNIGTGNFFCKFDSNLTKFSNDEFTTF
jgi:replicative DNA helicase